VTGVSLYAALWRRLPGRWPLKVAILVVAAAVVCVLLFLVVFPWIEPRLPFNHVTVDSPGSGG
jgi:tellurite resistance protein TehA-like permease